MNIISKERLQLVLSSNEFRGGNKQKRFVEMIERWRKNLFDKVCLNILKAINVR